MILNVWTVSALFLAGVGAALALSTLTLAIRGLLKPRTAPTPGERSSAEDGGHLLFLVVLVLSGVRLIAWPHFYWVLDSYVEDLAVFGVMCSYGVTQIDPERVRILELLKPIGLLAAGYWFVVGRALGGTAGARARILWAVPVSGLLLAEAVLEIVYLLREKAARPMTCCTQFLDTGSEPLAASGTASGLPAGVLLAGYVALLALSIAGAALLARRSRVPVFGLITMALLGPVSIVATFLAWPAAVAPHVLGLPYHRCLYELLTDTPAFGPAAVAAVAGGGALVGPLLLHLQSRGSRARVLPTQRALLRFAAIALASEGILVFIHLV